MMKSRKGFTLIELLIVVAIIGILAAIAIPNFLLAQVRAKVARAYEEMRNMGTALEIYRIDENAYPACAEWMRSPSTAPNRGDTHFETIGPSEEAGVNDMPVYLLTTPVPYLTDLPLDPFQEAIKSEIELETGWYWYWYWPGGRREGGFQLLFPPSYWMLVSMGPDKIFYREGPVREFSWKAHYDASNGTISSGDICRFGP